MNNELFVSIVVSSLFVFVFVASILIICCMDNLTRSDVEDFIQACDKCYMGFIDCICCIRSHNEVRPQRPQNQPIELEMTRMYSNTAVIINPQNILTLGTECKTSE